MNGPQPYPRPRRSVRRVEGQGTSEAAQRLGIKKAVMSKPVEGKRKRKLGGVNQQSLPPGKRFLGLTEENMSHKGLSLTKAYISSVVKVVSTCLTNILQWRSMVPGTPYLDLAASWNWIPGSIRHSSKLPEERADGHVSSKPGCSLPLPTTAPDAHTPPTKARTDSTAASQHPSSGPPLRAMPTGRPGCSASNPKRRSQVQKTRTRARSARLAALIQGSRAARGSQAGPPAAQPQQPADKPLNTTLPDATCTAQHSPTSYAVTVWASSAAPVLPPPYSPGGQGRRTRVQKDRSPLLSPLPRRQPLKLCTRRDQHARRALDLGLVEVTKSICEDSLLQKAGQAPSPPVAPPTPPPAFPSPWDDPAQTVGAGAGANAPSPLRPNSAASMVHAPGVPEAQVPSHALPHSARPGGMLTEPGQELPHVGAPQLPTVRVPAIPGPYPKHLEGKDGRGKHMQVRTARLSPFNVANGGVLAPACMPPRVGNASGMPTPLHPIAASTIPEMPPSSGDCSRLRRVSFRLPSPEQPESSPGMGAVRTSVPGRAVPASPAGPASRPVRPHLVFTPPPQLPYLARQRQRIAAAAQAGIINTMTVRVSPLRPGAVSLQSPARPSGEHTPGRRGGDGASGSSPQKSASVTTCRDVVRSHGPMEEMELSIPRSTVKHKRRSGGQVQESSADVRQQFREAYVNQKLAHSWAAGEMWAQTDFQGLVISQERCQAHNSVYEQASAKLMEECGADAAQAFSDVVHKEWLQLKSVRRRSIARAAHITCRLSQAAEDLRCGPRTPRSILRSNARRS